MKVKSKQEAWRKADIIFTTDYIKDDIRSTAQDTIYTTAQPQE